MEIRVLKQDYRGDYLPEEYIDKESGRHVIHQPIRTMDELEFRGMKIFQEEKFMKK